MSGSMLIMLVLVILFVLLVLLGYRRLSGSGCVPLLGIIFLLIMISIGGWELYQCEFNSPDQIKLAGHITDVSNPRPNNYLVILYRETEEIARDMTRLGQFDPDRKDAQNDGYFELTFPNEYKLTRCEMPMKFRLSPFRDGLPAFLWFRFEDLKAGDVEHIDIRDRNKKYTLVVFPESVDRFPAEIADPTYLDENGNVTINMEVMAYTLNGPHLNKLTTGQFIHTDFYAPGATRGAMSLPLADVQYAWVVDGTTTVISGSLSADKDSVDRNNCTGTAPLQEKVIKRLTYIHEVMFEQIAGVSIDLAMAALKAKPSLGFMHGQMGIAQVEVDVDVPAGAHTMYMVYWYELWKNGRMKTAVGAGTVDVPFRALSGVVGDFVGFPVDCP